jgi:putative ATP-binding cassette transporter
MHGLGQEQKTEFGSRQYLLRRFCATAIGYWRLGGERDAWLLTSGLFCLILLNLGISYELNVWNRTIFDALQQRDSTTVFAARHHLFPSDGD